MTEIEEKKLRLIVQLLEQLSEGERQGWLDEQIDYLKERRDEVRNPAAGRALLSGWR